MLNRAPYNTEVPQFVPSRDAPINSYITRKYPCQEHLAGKTNHFRTLTWKIQQPDSSMVWQSVKVVLPMAIQVCKKTGDTTSMALADRFPTCNIALSQSPMKAFRQTSLSVNGRIFSEDNYYRDILDACYRGVGAQAYGDNHSLKPIVHRNVHSTFHNEHIPVVWVQDGVSNPAEVDGNPVFAQVASVEHRTVNSAFNLLEHNGPFIERARIFQDNLSYDGETWKGEISHLLELGPFQARARKGNTAVPYIQDFHLRMNFQNMESKFDAQNPELLTDARHPVFAAGRTMAPKLLEFATLPNFLHHKELVSNFDGWPAGFTFEYTAQPYLEVVYTKHESPMRDSYNLRCFEHLYEQSNRFQLEAPAGNFDSPTSLQRVTSRLLSLPTKIYVWAEVSDEYKYAFAMGGVRRSCVLENLHLRVNQRPDVMFNPSQEECYEMFRRHTNSNLEYGSWLKSPIYCFDMVDVGQPDMFSNDARITWFEWDAAVKLTELQMVEQKNLQQENNLDPIGYDRRKDEIDDMRQVGGEAWVSSKKVMCWIDNDRSPMISHDDTDLHLTLACKRDGDNLNQRISAFDGPKMKFKRLVFEDSLRENFVSSDWEIDAIVRSNIFSLDGCIWAIMVTEDHDGNTKGDILGGSFYYIPESYRFQKLQAGPGMFNSLADITFVSANSAHFTNPNAPVTIIEGTLRDNGRLTDQDGKHIGTNVIGGAKWSPGPYGYGINGQGINNSSFLKTSFLSGAGGGSLPVIAEKPDNKTVWVCFGPHTGFVGWTKWLHDTSSQQLTNLGAPDNWPPEVAGDTPVWAFGVERLNLNTTGRWGVFQPEDFNNADTLRVEPYGAQMLAIQRPLLQQQQDALVEDYQLKVLYEYGNCQYNFSRDGAPTRILPNVVPVGPGPGIPAL